MRKQYVEWMKQAGWTRERSSGPNVFTFDLGDRTLVSFANFLETGSGVVFYDGSQLRVPFFSRIGVEIDPALTYGIALARRENGEFRSDKGGLGFVIECTDQLRAWAMGVDLEAEVKRLARPDHIYENFAHLAALARTGNVARLREYLAYRKRNPCDAPFVAGNIGPVISESHIERAIQIAQRGSKSRHAGDDSQEITSSDRDDYLPTPFDPKKLPIAFGKHILDDFKSMAAFESKIAKAAATSRDNVDVILAHSWILSKIVESGVLIDDVGNDARKALAIFEKVREAAQAARPVETAEFEQELNELLRRAEGFEARMKPSGS